MTNSFTPAKAGQQRSRLSKEEYAEKMKAYFIEMAGESYYNKIYKSQLESFLGVVSDSEKVTD